MNTHTVIVPEQDAAAATNSRGKRLLLMGVAPVLAVGLGLAAYLHGGRFVETDNAYAKADKVPISADVSGTITEVLTRENDRVSAGQLLFRIDPASFRIAVARAEARLAQVRTDLAALKASYQEKSSELALARTRHAYAEKDLQRQANLAQKGYLSPARLDESRQATQIAAQEIDAREHDLKRIAENLGGSPALPVEQHPSYLSAQAELEQARLDLQRSEVRASLAGSISKVPQPGQYISAGNTAMTLVVDDNLWVEANFPEKDLTYVRPGQPVDVRFDIYPDATWHGEVESLSPATGSEFSVLPAQNATGNWVKVAQRVPVRIHLRPDAQQPPLRAGLSAVVEIDTGHHRSLASLLP
ncbi:MULTISPECIES: HlyD family secretion protein [unclassified Pseudomonas]|uniref:HlyD family secretion protein n=1 Tax=unclassified Pseudomonas TaxID=196821 RepID=UPI000EAA86CC|nr:MULTISPECIES: HlyD family secretion protein [unclassified Pseudomonas]AYF86877.1 HlyD family secretion protein [Pseudomonas sp. DY-1]MDH4652288.1 HlyD family secretion protein [Pseudomonas sp. BN606]MRK24299.1 HlyD family secretion protein [Pseudomonas sp. JG-B]